MNGVLTSVSCATSVIYETLLNCVKSMAYASLLTVFIATLAAPLLAQDKFAQEQSLDKVQASVSNDLKLSIRRLSAQRERIANEKIPLATKLNVTESDIRQLRQTAQRFQAIRDSRELGLSDMKSKLADLENESTYVVNLLNEYAAFFENSLNISEIDRFRQEIDKLESLAGNSTGTSRVEGQMKLIELGMERVRSSLGGESYPGNIVNDDSKLVAGTFSRFGPVVYFLDQPGKLGGIVNKDDGLNAHILELNDSLDQLVTLTAGGLTDIPMDVTGGKVTAISGKSDSLLSHINKGGVWIFPILLFALVSLLISVYKMVEIYRVKLPSSGAVRDILLKIKSSELNAAESLADQLPSPVGQMLGQGVKYCHESRELVEEILYEKILEARPGLESWLPVIAITAATAPLLGLLGTVTGMINTFNLITVFGTGDARLLSSGISEALVTTEFGLIVAIPALIIHGVLSRKVKSILADMEKYALIFCNGLPVKVTAAAS